MKSSIKITNFLFPLGPYTPLLFRVSRDSIKCYVYFEEEAELNIIIWKVYSFFGSFFSIYLVKVVFAVPVYPVIIKFCCFNAISSNIKEWDIVS